MLHFGGNRNSLCENFTILLSKIYWKYFTAMQQDNKHRLPNSRTAMQKRIITSCTVLDCSWGLEMRPWQFKWWINATVPSLGTTVRATRLQTLRIVLTFLVNVAMLYTHISQGAACEGLQQGRFCNFTTFSLRNIYKYRFVKYINWKLYTFLYVI